jgi:FKBP-type peptidyl-prolyl cis-trans isomerase
MTSLTVAIAAARKAEADKAAAEQAAAERERQRVADEQRAEAEAAAKREADKAHKAKINNEALTALVAAGLSDADAKAAIGAIAKGLVPNVKINY